MSDTRNPRNRQKFSATTSVVALAITIMAIGGCGGKGNGGLTKGLAGATASFEVVAKRPQRIMVGISSEDGKVLAGGTAAFTFRPSLGGNERLQADATYLPIAGQADVGFTGSRFVAPSESIGVYAAPAVVFPSPGVWLITAEADTDRGRIRVEQPVQVIAAARIPAPGDMAPKTRNPVFGTPGVTPVQLDSRADAAVPDEALPDEALPDEALPDEALHRVVIAESIAAKRPLVVVVSTPVYCTSRFCGPVTDAVQALVPHYPGVDFVHLEVWKDFETSTLNPAAAEWMFPAGSDAEGNEPWVFLVGRDGRIVNRFDNVVSNAQLDAAVAALATASASS